MVDGNAFLKWSMIGGGLVQVAVGVLATLDTKLVGSAHDAVLTMNAMHGQAHLVVGLVSLAIGLGLRGMARVNATLVYGALFMVGFAVNIASPDLWGRMSVPANDGVHVMHFTIAFLSLAAGYVAWSQLAQPYMRRHHGAPMR